MNVVDTLRGDALPAGLTVLSPQDSCYPPLLRTIHDPPARLWVRGDPHFLLRPQLAIVGARRASPAALRLARRLAGELVTAGLQVCSGLALGVDGAAHRAALDAGGSTVGVMATGIDRLYPQRHRTLATDMLQAGCLVTEFAPGEPPRRGHFPRRNRIISGMSLGVLVVEAALPSGSLITANTALEQGREVFTLPWSIAHPGGAGCLQLLRDGAKMVRDIDDVLEELGPLFTLQQSQLPQSTEPQADTPEGAALLALVGFEPVTLDELLVASQLSPPDVMAALSRLELGGCIQRCPGGYIRG